MDDIDTLFFSYRELYKDHALLKLSVAIEAYVSLLNKDMGKLVESIVNIDKDIRMVKSNIQSLESRNVNGATNVDLEDEKNKLDSLNYQNHNLHSILADKLKLYKSCHTYT